MLDVLGSSRFPGGFGERSLWTERGLAPLAIAASHFPLPIDHGEHHLCARLSQLH